MARKSEFIFDMLSDIWEQYEDRDQIASLWEGYLQISSDLIISMLQGHFSKSIIDIPVFRKYKWINYQLLKTVTPSSFTSPFQFAYDTGNPDIAGIPNLSDLVQDAPDEEVIQVTNSGTGVTQVGSELVDTATPFPVATRVGDLVRFVSGTGLNPEDLGPRFRILSINSATSLTLNADDLPAATSVKYYIERSPHLILLESVNYVVDSGVLNFSPTPVLTADDSETAFQIVEELEWTGDFVRDDPRLIAAGGNAVVNGNAGQIVIGSGVLTDLAATFVTSGVSIGDYLALRPSGMQPSQILTSQVVSKIVNVISETQLEFNGTSPTSSIGVKYDVIRPSSEDFDLVNSENGTDEFPMAYAFKTVGALSPSGTTGEIIAAVDPDGDEFRDTSKDFSGLLGKELRVLSGSGLDPAELSRFLIREIRNGPSFDTVLLDRKVTNYSSAPDAVYLVGDVLAIDVVYPR